MQPSTLALDAMRAALESASERKLGRVVGLLDGMSARGVADALLAPARPRLRALRPQRPLRFTRLLCLPLEGALVATEAWDGRPGRIPRAALAPLGEAVKQALGEAAEEIEAAALGHSMAEEKLVRGLGLRLWKLAAEAAPELPPPGWYEAGLPERAAAPILALCQLLWAEAAAAGSSSRLR